MYDLIIIGAGPAGLYAATCAAMNKINAVLIESSLEIGGQLTLVVSSPSIKKKRSMICQHFIKSMQASFWKSFMNSKQSTKTLFHFN